MVRILLLVSLFSPMSIVGSMTDKASVDNSVQTIPTAGVTSDSQNFGPQIEELVRSTASFVEVRFNKAPLVTVGDPVLFNGAIVGSISRIELAEMESGVANLGESGNRGTNVSIRLLQEDFLRDASLVALVGSMKSRVAATKGGKASSRSFLELMAFGSGSPTELSYVKGFTSFQEFWAARSFI